MKWTACLVVLAACQRDPAPTADPGATAGTTAAGTTIIQLPKPALDDAYKADIAALCDALQRSGAEEQTGRARQVTVAMWLGPNIKTETAHEFLIAIQPLQGEAKAVALENEAKRSGLAGCPLAAEWRTPSL